MLNGALNYGNGGRPRKQKMDNYDRERQRENYGYKWG